MGASLGVCLYPETEATPEVVTTPCDSSPAVSPLDNHDNKITPSSSKTAPSTSDGNFSTGSENNTPVDRSVTDDVTVNLSNNKSTPVGTNVDDYSVVTAFGETSEDKSDGTTVRTDIISKSTSLSKRRIRCNNYTSSANVAKNNTTNSKTPVMIGYGEEFFKIDPLVLLQNMEKFGILVLSKQYFEKFHQYGLSKTFAIVPFAGARNAKKVKMLNLFSRDLAITAAAGAGATATATAAFPIQLQLQEVATGIDFKSESQFHDSNVEDVEIDEFVLLRILRCFDNFLMNGKIDSISIDFDLFQKVKRFLNAGGRIGVGFVDSENYFNNVEWVMKFDKRSIVKSRDEEVNFEYCFGEKDSGGVINIRRLARNSEFVGVYGLIFKEALDHLQGKLLTENSSRVSEGNPLKDMKDGNTIVSQQQQQQQVVLLNSKAVVCNRMMKMFLSMVKRSVTKMMCKKFHCPMMKRRATTHEQRKEIMAKAAIVAAKSNQSNSCPSRKTFSCLPSNLSRKSSSPKPSSLYKPSCSEGEKDSERIIPRRILLAHEMRQDETGQKYALIPCRHGRTLIREGKIKCWRNGKIKCWCCDEDERELAAEESAMISVPKVMEKNNSANTTEESAGPGTKQSQSKKKFRDMHPLPNRGNVRAWVEFMMRFEYNKSWWSFFSYALVNTHDTSIKNLTVQKFKTLDAKYTGSSQSNPDLMQRWICNREFFKHLYTVAHGKAGPRAALGMIALADAHMLIIPDVSKKLLEIYVEQVGNGIDLCIESSIQSGDGENFDYLKTFNKLLHRKSAWGGKGIRNLHGKRFNWWNWMCELAKENGAIIAMILEELRVKAETAKVANNFEVEKDFKEEGCKFLPWYTGFDVDGCEGGYDNGSGGWYEGGKYYYKFPDSQTGELKERCDNCETVQNWVMKNGIPKVWRNGGGSGGGNSNNVAVSNCNGIVQVQESPGRKHNDPAAHSQPLARACSTSSTVTVTAVAPRRTRAPCAKSPKTRVSKPLANKTTSFTVFTPATKDLSMQLVVVNQQQERFDIIASLKMDGLCISPSKFQFSKTVLNTFLENSKSWCSANFTRKTPLIKSGYRKLYSNIAIKNIPTLSISETATRSRVTRHEVNMRQARTNVTIVDLANNYVAVSPANSGKPVAIVPHPWTILSTKKKLRKQRAVMAARSPRNRFQHQRKRYFPHRNSEDNDGSVTTSTRFMLCADGEKEVFLKNAVKCNPVKGSVVRTDSHFELETTTTQSSAPQATASSKKSPPKAPESSPQAGAKVAFIKGRDGNIAAVLGEDKFYHAVTPCQHGNRKLVGKEGDKIIRCFHCLDEQGSGDESDNTPFKRAAASKTGSKPNRRIQTKPSQLTCVPVVSNTVSKLQTPTSTRKRYSTSKLESTATREHCTPTVRMSRVSQTPNTASKRKDGRGSGGSKKFQ